MQINQGCTFSPNFSQLFYLQGDGLERLLIKGKKPDQVEEVDGDPFRYFLLAGRKMTDRINQCDLQDYLADTFGTL